MNYATLQLYLREIALILRWALPTVDVLLHDRPLVEPHLYPVHTRWEKNNRARVQASILLTNVFLPVDVSASSQRHIAICLGLYEVPWAILIIITTTIPTDMNYHRRRTSHPHHHRQRRVTSRCSAAALCIRGESHPVYAALSEVLSVRIAFRIALRSWWVWLICFASANSQFISISWENFLNIYKFSTTQILKKIRKVKDCKMLLFFSEIIQTPDGHYK